MVSFMHTHRPARSSGRTSPGDASWLPVTQRGDARERDADMLADRTARAPAASTARRPQLRPSPNQGRDHAGGAGAVPPGGGRPLEPAVRGGMESSFGWDFSGVRVHSGDEASSMAQRMQARAYTVGHDIVLGRGELIVGAQAGASSRMNWRTSSSTTSPAALCWPASRRQGESPLPQ